MAKPSLRQSQLLHLAICKLRDNALVEMATGASKAGALTCLDMCSRDELCKVLQTNARIMAIIKPYANERETLDRIEICAVHWLSSWM